ncbi:hypothetical protein CPAV1605_104 [seawater metagenome]|uniref:Uncharacterized protein n=1 Tax=seawater metagenome TaxID=1561972 RepID=A0A5E8CL57_9ZZZZ
MQNLNTDCFNTTLKYIIGICLFIVIVNFLFPKNIENFDNSINIQNPTVKKKYNSLTKKLGQPTYLEKNQKNNLKSATWMSPLNNFNDFGKYQGCDYIKIEGFPAKKYHPHPAIVFLMIGKYVQVPEHLLGPLKYASETINIEQLFVPKKYQDKYQKTGKKDYALVTGSCASVTISAITVQFAIDMINKYKNQKSKCLELYQEFRNEYDRRINDYLCGKGITNKVSWFDPKLFDEEEKMNIGKEKCEKKSKKLL